MRRPTQSPHAAGVLALALALPLATAWAQTGQHPQTPQLNALAAARVAGWMPLPILAQAGAAEAVAVLPALESKVAAHRAGAAFILGQTRVAAAIPHLVPLLSDSNREVRLTAGLSLACLGDKRGADASASALRSGRTWQRYYAVLGLWTIGTDAARGLLVANSYGQPAFIANCIDSALHGWTASRATMLPKPGAKPYGGPAVALHEAWQAAANSFVMEADWWWHHGNYDQCIRSGDAELFLDPTDVETYSNNAWLLWSMGRHTEAIGEYHRAIRANPKSASAYYYLGTYYLIQHQPKYAEPYLKKAADLAPENHLYHRAYAHSLEDVGKLREALEQWREVLKLRPTDGAAIHNRDRLLKELAAQK